MAGSSWEQLGADRGWLPVAGGWLAGLQATPRLALRLLAAAGCWGHPPDLRGAATFHYAPNRRTRSQRPKTPVAKYMKTKIYKKYP